jgi:hypothetical protein
MNVWNEWITDSAIYRTAWKTKMTFVRSGTPNKGEKANIQGCHG